MGLWVANGQAELRVTEICLILLVVLLAEEIKADVLDWVFYFKNKNDLK